MPSVSVIIPTYNRADFLAEAVDSVLGQTWKDLEVIVVDDGSTDESQEILRRYGDRVRFFYQENEGPSSARNLGASRARGQFLAFLDSDDVWEPNKLDAQMAFLRSHPDVRMVCCGGYVLGKSRRRRTPIARDLSGDLFLRLYLRSFINTSSVVLARECFFEVGPFDPMMRTAEDYDFWLRVAHRFRIGYLKAPLVGIRKHSDELSRNKVELRRNAIRVIERHFDKDRVPGVVYRRRLADLHVYLGRGYRRIGDFRAARAAFRQAMHLAPFRLRPIRYYLGTFVVTSQQRGGLKKP